MWAGGYLAILAAGFVWFVRHQKGAPAPDAMSAAPPLEVVRHPEAPQPPPQGGALPTEVGFETLGKILLPLAELGGDITSLRVNGETMHYTLTSADAGLGAVLDKVERECKENPSIVAGGWKAAIPDAGPVIKGIPDVLNASKGIVREQWDQSDVSPPNGIVFCFLQGRETPTNFKEAFDKFSKTRDLGALGVLRYTFAKTVPSGRTQIFSLSTGESFHADALAGAERGEDPQGVPPPPGGKRLLSARVEGTPYGVYVYSTSKSVSELSAHYDETMFGRGWVQFGHPHEQSEARGYVKDGAEVTMSVMPGEQNGQSFLAITEAKAPMQSHATQ